MSAEIIILSSFTRRKPGTAERERSERCGNRTRLRPGDGALVHGDPLAHVVVGLERDDIVGAGVCGRQRDRLMEVAELIGPKLWRLPTHN